MGDKNGVKNKLMFLGGDE